MFECVTATISWEIRRRSFNDHVLAVVVIHKGNVAVAIADTMNADRIDGILEGELALIRLIGPSGDDTPSSGVASRILEYGEVIVGGGKGSEESQAQDTGEMHVD